LVNLQLGARNPAAFILMAGVLGFVLVAIAFWLVVRDLKERIRVQRNLVAAEEKYRRLFDQIPQPMYVFDLVTLRFLAVNRATIEKYGYARDEFLTMTLTDIRRHEDIP